ncbi:flavin-containing monooxygenase [Micrococcus luteus]|uniref:flavin-containing monooxygenase n=1 Tax=Micrococcus luteus TaxID=1270 RepID=UPI002A53672F|nr:NAD(P)/FAD-dependent oxidoreductase [Micrococcus luteus]
MADADVLVIGAGLAGLVMGHYLNRAGLHPLLVDRAPALGHSWRSRWNSLRLFTPARHNRLADLLFPGDPEAYPGKDAVADYLQDFARHQSLTPATGTAITDLHGRLGAFTATTATGRQLRARSVVVATGAFGTPFLPDWAARDGRGPRQLHAKNYRTPASVPGQEVLAVGGGNTGVQIALELAATGKRVHLSTGRPRRHLPQRLGGKDMFWWLTRTGAMSAPAGSVPGKWLRAHDPIIGTDRAALTGVNIRTRPRATGLQGGIVGFADGTRYTPEVIVWATGYRHADRWIRIPAALDPTGVLHAPEGVSPVAGLYTIGRSWQRNRGSALLGFVSTDAAPLAQTILTALAKAP